MSTGKLHAGSAPAERHFRNQSSYEERVPVIAVKEELGDLVQFQNNNGKSSDDLDFLEDLHFTGTVEAAREVFHGILPTSSDAKNRCGSRIPTSLSEFEISLELQDDLRRGCRGGLLAPRQDAGDLVERVCKESSDYALLRKQEARTFLKAGNRDLQKSASADTRSRTRSRIEAEVSRIRDEQYKTALKRAIRWIVLNTETRHPNDCLCDSSNKRMRS